jgi:hypothetical protein
LFTSNLPSHSKKQNPSFHYIPKACNGIVYFFIKDLILVSGVYNTIYMTRYDPSTIFPIFIVVVVLLGVIYANTSRQKFLNQVIAQITPHDTDSPSPTPTESASPTPSPTITPSPTQREALLTPSPRATTMAQINNSVSNSNATSNNDLNQFRYPNGKTISSSSTEIKIESPDSPDKITDWYKEKIKGLGMNTQSFVTTNTNNNVLNSLAAAGNGINIKIEIKKDAGASFTSIKITH